VDGYKLCVRKTCHYVGNNSRDVYKQACKTSVSPLMCKTSKEDVTSRTSEGVNEVRHPRRTESVKQWKNTEGLARPKHVGPTLQQKHSGTCHLPLYLYILASGPCARIFFGGVKALSAVGVTIISNSTQLFCILQLVINLLLSH